MTKISQYVGLTIPNLMISSAFKYCFSGYGQYTIFRTKAEAKSYLKNNSVIHRIKDLLTITDELRQKISDTPRHDIFEIIDNVAVPLEIEMDDEKNWWSIEQQKWITLDEGVAEQWKDRLHTMREKSAAGISFADALAVVITDEEWRELSEEKQTQLKVAWTYPTNDDGEIETRSDDEIRDQLWNDSNPENCDGCANQESIAAPGETTKCRKHQEKSDDEHYAEMSKFFDENVMDMQFNTYLPFCSRCGKSEPDYVGMMKYSNQSLMPITFAFCVACRDVLVQLQIQRTQSPERFGV